MKKVVFGLLLVSLSGCAGQTLVLENANGETAKCEVSTMSAMMTGTLIRDARMKKCARELEEKGFTKVADVKHEI